jgi:hypothetical protein
VCFDGSSDIDNDDGDVETAVAADLVRAVGGSKKGVNPSRSARIEEGSKVEANYRGKGKFYPGRVKRDRGDGTFDVDYNDSDQEMRVPADMIRLLDEPGSGGGSGLPSIVSKGPEPASVSVLC